MKITALLASLLFGVVLPARAGDLVLWYRQPAHNAMNEALPVGNGRLGGVVFGCVESERIQFNEDSLWTGGTNPGGDYDGMGAYQTFGDLLLSFEPGKAAAPTAYRRQLDLAMATARTEFTRENVTYTREVFASHPAQLIVARWSAGTKGAITGVVELKGAHREATAAEGTTLSFSGKFDNGMLYEATARVLARGGSIKAGAGKIELKGCDEVVVLLAAGTDYVMDYEKQYHGESPHQRLARALDAAGATTYEVLKAEHTRDFQALFHRVTANFGKSTAAQTALPTDLRKVEAAKTVDRELEALMFQYGRYLLIASSRPGGLPANLQGLWNDSNNPPWHCDYHSNINIQMNYWPAEAGNLAECHLPFFDLIRSQIPSWRKLTAASKDFRTNHGTPSTRGFAIRTSHNITGGMGWKWDNTANAWYCQHLWEHYAFGGDKEYLRTVAYPILKETCEFWEDHLKTLPDGRLVVPNAWSPEHGPTEDGVSYSQEIVWDLFTNTMEACAALGIDQEYCAKVAAMRSKLATPGVGSWGQLMEWMQEKKGSELDTPQDHHRHTSHLFGVYPGRQIGVVKTPTLAKAAKVSLDARGPTGDVREWSFAWRTALYARLHDGESAHAMLQQLLSARNTCLNLFGLHPPMQLDGNFGITAGIAEMLVQSHEGEISLLPALPSAWPEGSIRGLRARGGFEVDLDWKSGKLSKAVVRAVTGTICRVRYGGKTVDVRLSLGESRVFTGAL